MRDLLRRRTHLVSQRTALLLSTQNLLARNTGEQLSGNAVRVLSWESIEERLPEPIFGLAVRTNRKPMRLERGLLMGDP